jgi:hypothetical protein
MRNRGVSRLSVIALLIIGSISVGYTQVIELTSNDTDFGVFRVIVSNKLTPRLFTKLDKNSVVEVSPKQYVVLLHKSGATIELNKGGKYQVTALEKQLYTYARSQPQGSINLNIQDPQRPSTRYKYYRYWNYRCPQPKLEVLLSGRYILDKNLKVNIYGLPSSKTYELVVRSGLGGMVLRKIVREVPVALVLPNISSKRYAIKLRKFQRRNYYRRTLAYNCAPEILLQYVEPNEIAQTYQDFQAKIHQYTSALVKGIQEVIFWYNQGFALKANEVYKQLSIKHQGNVVLTNAYKHFRVYYGFERLVSDND